MAAEMYAGITRRSFLKNSTAAGAIESKFSRLQWCRQEKFGIKPVQGI
jgi:hypothetical protein